VCVCVCVCVCCVCVCVCVSALTHTDTSVYDYEGEYVGVNKSVAELLRVYIKAATATQINVSLIIQQHAKILHQNMDKHQEKYAGSGFLSNTSSNFK